MTEIESCYFAALIDGLRLIGERERETGKALAQIDAGALGHYVLAKGKQIAIACDVEWSPAPEESEPDPPRPHVSVATHRKTWRARGKRMRLRRSFEQKAPAELTRQNDGRKLRGDQTL